MREDKQQYYELLINNLPLGFSIVDENGIIIDANDNAAQITGHRIDELIGRSHHAIFHATAGDEACPLLKYAFEDRKSVVDCEVDMQKRDGEVITLAVTAAPLFNDKGSFVGGVELFRDITDIKKLERERKNILSMFAHDIKNPVATAVGFLTRVMSGKSKDQQSDFESIKDELKTAESLIADFLQYSRFEAKQYQPAMKPFNIVGSLRKQVESQVILADEKHIKIRSEIAEEGFPDINADETMVNRVIANLIGNAIKYTNPDGEINVRLLNRDKDILVQVQDTGIGIPSDKLPFVFDAFYRVSGDQKGSGLGLSISKTIVTAHGGKIWAESILGQGSTFSFTLPKLK
ncbi:MAG: ATP-binding protein [Dissulfurispiraceae bacterium]|jgi:two-component system, OmpR family, phosphate regulon sensor histidine kinase PhoR